MSDISSSSGRPCPPLRDDQELLLNTITKSLSSDESNILSSPLKDIEMCEAIKHMRGHSSPGMDGLPASFYQIAPVIFGECLRIVFDYQLERGILLQYQRPSAISLLYMKSSRADPGNYRPIALICVE